MKILLDENLSYRLVSMLADLFSEAAHVRDFDLTRADDDAIWEFAKSNGFTIVSKDDDFHQKSFLHGYPPKVVWLRLGNCTTEQVAATLRSSVEHIAKFEIDQQAAFLVLP